MDTKAIEELQNPEGNGSPKHDVRVNIDLHTQNQNLENAKKRGTEMNLGGMKLDPQSKLFQGTLTGSQQNPPKLAFDSTAELEDQTQKVRISYIGEGSPNDALAVQSSINQSRNKDKMPKESGGAGTRVSQHSEPMVTQGNNDRSQQQEKEFSTASILPNRFTPAMSTVHVNNNVGSVNNSNAGLANRGSGIPISNIIRGNETNFGITSVGETLSVNHHSTVSAQAPNATMSYGSPGRRDDFSKESNSRNNVQQSPQRFQTMSDYVEAAQFQYPPQTAPNVGNRRRMLVQNSQVNQAQKKTVSRFLAKKMKDNQNRQSLEHKYWKQSTQSNNNGRQVRSNTQNQRHNGIQSSGYSPCSRGTTKTGATTAHLSPRIVSRGMRTVNVKSVLQEGQRTQGLVLNQYINKHNLSNMNTLTPGLRMNKMIKPQYAPENYSPRASFAINMTAQVMSDKKLQNDSVLAQRIMQSKQGLNQTALMKNATAQFGGYHYQGTPKNNLQDQNEQLPTFSNVSSMVPLSQQHQLMAQDALQKQTRDQILVQNLNIIHNKDNSSQDTKRRSSIKTSAVEGQFDGETSNARTSKSQMGRHSSHYSSNVPRQFYRNSKAGALTQTQGLSNQNLAVGQFQNFPEQYLNGSIKFETAQDIVQIQENSVLQGSIQASDFMEFQKPNVQHLHEMVEVDKNLKSHNYRTIQQAKDILREPFADENLLAYFKKLQNYNQTPIGEDVSLQQQADTINEQIEDNKRLTILLTSARLKDQGKKKSLYENRASSILDAEKNKFNQLDRAFQKTTIMAHEQDVNRKIFPQRGNSSDVASAGCWRRTQTIQEQHDARIDFSDYYMAHFNKTGQIPPALLAHQYYQDLRRIKSPMKHFELDDSIDAKTLSAMKNKYREHDILNRKPPKLEKDNLLVWRDQMKELEDSKNFARMYDRIGRDHVSLMAERVDARRDSTLQNKRKYHVISQQDEAFQNHSPVQDPEKKIMTTLDVAVTPQSSIKQAMSKVIYKDKMKIHELKKQIVKCRKQMTTYQVKKELKLHPLQREQALHMLMDQRQENTIMRDFSVDDLRQNDIFNKQEEDLNEQIKREEAEAARKEQEHELIKSANSKAVQMLHSANGYNIRYQAKHIKERQDQLNRLYPHLADRFENFHDKDKELINAGVFQEHITMAGNILDEIKPLKVTAVQLEDQIKQHNSLVESSAYERMAIDAIEQSKAAGRNMKDLLITYDEAHALSNLVGQDFKIKVKKQTKLKADEIRKERQEIWNQSVQESKQDPNFNKKSNACIHHDPKRCRCKSLSESPQRIQSRSPQKAKDAKTSSTDTKNVLFTDKMQKQAIEIQRKSQLYEKKHEDVSLVGSDRKKVYQLIKGFYKKRDFMCDLNIFDMQRMLRYFTKWTTLFASLKFYVMQELEIKELLTPQLQTKIANLCLDEEFLDRILRNSCKLVHDVNTFRASQGPETFLYYILDGAVNMVNVDDESQVITVNAEQFFELNLEIQKTTRIELPENPLKQDEQGRSDENVNFQKQSFLKFQVSQLVPTFMKQIDVQYDFIKSELLKFEMFTHLTTDQIEFLAAGGDDCCTFGQYLPDEVIVEEGYHPLNFFCVVVQGCVRIEKALSIKQSNIWPKGKNIYQKVQQTQNATCNMGEIKSYEPLGLREMLCIEVKNHGMIPQHLPAQCRYSAKDNGPTLTTKVIKISYNDFKKVFPHKQLHKVLEQLGLDTGNLKQLPLPIQKEDSGYHVQISKDELENNVRAEYLMKQQEKAMKKDLRFKGRLVVNQSVPRPISAENRQSKSIKNSKEGSQVSNSILRVSNQRDPAQAYQNQIQPHVAKQASGVKVVPFSPKSNENQTELVLGMDSSEIGEVQYKDRTIKEEKLTSAEYIK